MNRGREPLLHPAFLGALALLWLNDHVWKTAHPGLLTGKLSDFAGLFMLPIVVHALAARAGVRGRSLPDALSLLGAAWFALANLWPPAQLAFEHGLGRLRWLPRALVSLEPGPVHPVSLTRDPTDLVALVMIVPALVLVGRRPPSCPARSLARPSSP